MGGGRHLIVAVGAASGLLLYSDGSGFLYAGKGMEGDGVIAVVLYVWL